MPTTMTHDPPDPHSAPLPKGLILAISVLAIIGSVGAGASVMSAVSAKARQQSDRVSSCRASFSSELVTGPTAEALQAIALHGIESSEFVDAVEGADPRRFQDLIVLSRTDPGEFLRICSRADLDDTTPP